VKKSIFFLQSQEKVLYFILGKRKSAKSFIFYNKQMWHKIIQDKQNELKNLSIKPRDYYFDPQLLELNKIISFI
jgi:hypothetical protein